MNITLIAARAYQCQTGCSNAQAVAYVYAIKSGLNHKSAMALNGELTRDLLENYGVMRGSLCAMCHKGRNCGC